ncbi:unnamed protein product [Urochloa humidicola]
MAASDDAYKTVASACTLMNDYIDKACALATKLGFLESPPTNGNEASSAFPPIVATPAVPVHGDTLQDVEMAEADEQNDNDEPAFNQNGDNTNLPAVSGFFVTPAPPLLIREDCPAPLSPPQAAAVSRRRPRRVFDMTADIIAALSEMFNIANDDDAEELDRALAGLVDEGVAELHEAVQELQEEAAAAHSATD